jgi:hypothetical protein
MGDPTSVGLTELAIATFTKKAVDTYQASDDDSRIAKGKKLKKKTTRGIWELTGAQQQCDGVFKMLDIPPLKYGTTLCWICGFPILNLSGLTYECEHVLPVAQATFFLTLYSSSLKNRIEGREQQFFHLDNNIDASWAAWNKEALRLEYDFAHEYCNQVKTDTSFIKFDEAENIVPDEIKIIEFLNALTIVQRNGASDIHRFINDVGRNNWLTNRKDVLVKRYADIAKLISHGQRGIAKLIMLAGAINVSDPLNIKPIFLDILEKNKDARAFIYHIRLNEFALRNNWKQLAPVIANSIFRAIRTSFDFEPTYWKEIENKIDLDFKDYDMDDNLSVSNTNTNMNVNVNVNVNDTYSVSILATLAQKVESELRVLPVEEFMPNNNNDSGNNGNGMNINDDDDDENMDSLTGVAQDFIQSLKKVVDYYAFKFYENIYKGTFTDYTTPGIPDKAEPIAIETVYLYVFGYFLNIALILDKQRIRAKKRIPSIVNNKTVSVLDYLRKNFDTIYTLLTTDERITNPTTRNNILQGLNNFVELKEDLKKRKVFMKLGGARKTRGQGQRQQRQRQAQTRKQHKRSRRS